MTEYLGHGVQSLLLWAAYSYLFLSPLCISLLYFPLLNSCLIATVCNLIQTMKRKKFSVEGNFIPLFIAY